ncbi:YhcH/YjgK/YiaL family protein [Streptococcus halichoeri]|uniref:YhcH/YjgK/YiaL family protein n=1 Tax=Streptococcus halichoeri TaxID=254785 RepID=UPI000DB5DA28|nr:YhcH/YjgK/YiaL family protein [Streptococcus halichoeri]PZO95315.1 MAG: YhcH/YjgK/YiaL family protein [Streptococcus pyogenes]
MIIAERSDFKTYIPLNPHFATVWDFLTKTDLTTLEDGKIDIDGANVFANCMTYVADGTAGQVFETHKQYLDIHLVLTNTEKIAVAAPASSQLKVAFDDAQDFALYESEQYQLLELTTSNLLVAFAADFHQPKIRINDQPVKKLVIKVLNQEVNHEA